jgi:SAM-dependent methyltransferase
MLRRLNFSLWYFFRPPWDSGISPPELFEFIAQHSPGRAIDLGCGTGTNVITLLQRGWQVTGIDFAPRAISLARRKLKRAGVQADLRIGDVTRLDGIRGPFDLALDIGCFHGLPSQAAYLSQLTRLLAPGGHWLMYGRLKTEAADSPVGLTPESLNLIASTGLELVSRTDGVDKHSRPSAWLLYRRPASPKTGR